MIIAKQNIFKDPIAWRVEGLPVAPFIPPTAIR